MNQLTKHQDHFISNGGFFTYKEFLMDLREYQLAAMRTAKKLPLDLAMVHGAMGVASEIAEFLEALDTAQASSDSDEVFDITLELGDAFWFLTYMTDSLGVGIHNLPHILDVVPSVEFYSSSKPVIAAGEILTLVKRHMFYGKRVDLQKLLDQIGITWIALTQCAVALNINPHYVLEMNIEKLKRRYPQAYSDEAALGRADEQSVEPVDNAVYVGAFDPLPTLFTPDQIKPKE